MSSQPQPLYQPLQGATEQIRLAQITSKAGAKDIQISLRVVDLQSRQSYKALSYVWGTGDTRAVQIEGRECHIGLNLYRFLQVLQDRQQETERPWIWIDQLCIDQSNSKERSSQVGIMDQIYKHAEETIIWLGPDPTKGLAFSTINTVVRRYTESRDRGLNEKQTVDFAARDAMRTMNDNAYWKRHWIIQELILSAQHTRTLWYGTSTLQLSTLHYLLDHHNEAMTNSPWPNTYPVQRLYNTEAALAKQDEFSMWKAAMDLAKYSACSDARDKIYGIQSLFPEALRIQVDYGKDKAEVYRDAVLRYDEVLGPKFKACLGYEDLAKAMGWRVLKPPYYRGYCAESYWRSKEENKKALLEMLDDMMK